MKRCAKCECDKNIVEFCAMKKSKDGLHPWCRECRSAYNRAWAQARPGYYAASVVSMRKRYPDRQRARQIIHQDVKMGRRPKASTLECVDCKAKAAAYDHARGYEPPNDRYVEPVCHRCHGLRSRARGEHAGPGSHRKAGGVIGLPYLDGVQHAAFPEVPRG
jgi:hypothetical protein